MKKLALLFFVFHYSFFTIPSVSAQWGNSCLPEGITFSSQAQIDSFQTDYPGCVEIEGDVTINGGNSIINLNGLSALTSIGGSLEIYGNNALSILTGLEGLTSIGGDLDISDNFALTSLTGLDNIAAGSFSYLYIVYNYSLSTCAVQSICDYLTNGGYSNIYGNANGCDNSEQVDSACVYISNGDITLAPAFSIFPNPTTDQITISMPSTPFKSTFMTIYNINGQQLIKRQIMEPIINVDVSGLSQGVYFVKVADDRTVQVGKFVKQ